MLFDIAIKNLWRRKLRSILTILGVAVAVQLYLTMDGWMGIYEQDLQHQLSAFAGKIFIQQPMEASAGGQDFPSFSSSLDAASAEALLGIEGVNPGASSAVLFVQLARASSPNMPPAAVAVGLEPGHEAAYLGNFKVESGGSTTLTGPDSVILGSSAARRYQTDGSDEPVSPGDAIEIQGARFTVAGVLKPASMLYDNSAILPLETAQELFRRPGSVSAVILTADRLDGVDSIQAAIQEQFPDLQASGQGEIAKNTDAMLAGQRDFFDMVNATVILVAIVVVTIVVVVAVMEQRREIGTLRALGARRWRIFSLVFSEALVLSMLGAIVALPMSILLRWVLQITTGGSASDVGGLFDINPIPAWLGTIGIAVVIGLLASLLPAWQAMRVDPLEALRYE